jgi:hypothetical protein
LEPKKPDLYQDEGDVLRPEHDVDVEAEPVDRDLHALRDGVDPADAVEDDVDGADEDLPEAVEREEVPEKVEVLALPRLGPLDPLAHVLHVVNLHEQLPVELLQGKDVLVK